MLLFLRASVVRLAFLIQTAFVADADGVGVVVLGMGALDGFGQQGDDIAIAADIIVVTALAVLGLACGNQGLHTEGTVALRGTTVNNDKVYCTHD